jgi:hypothetical protein
VKDREYSRAAAVHYSFNDKNDQQVMKKYRSLGALYYYYYIVFSEWHESSSTRVKSHNTDDTHTTPNSPQKWTIAISFNATKDKTLATTWICFLDANWSKTSEHIVGLTTL